MGSLYVERFLPRANLVNDGFEMFSMFHLEVMYNIAEFIIIYIVIFCHQDLLISDSELQSC